MDTGYVNLISDEAKRNVLHCTRAALGPGVPFYAGIYVEHNTGDLAGLYRREIEQILTVDAVPVIFQSIRMHGLSSTDKIKLYQEICRDIPEAIAFELGAMFATNGEIWDDVTAQGIMEIPNISGMKHSSLSRSLEMQRLHMRDKIRPDFRIYTGNDLGISMVEYGSDYLLGLATFFPEAFSARDRAWQNGSLSYFALSDALQHLGNVAFRAPVPAYKHSAAVFLHLRHRIPSALTHPNSPSRPLWENEMMSECLDRILSAMPSEESKEK